MLTFKCDQCGKEIVQSVGVRCMPAIEMFPGAYIAAKETIAGAFRYPKDWLVRAIPPSGYPAVEYVTRTYCSKECCLASVDGSVDEDDLRFAEGVRRVDRSETSPMRKAASEFAEAIDRIFKSQG